MSRVAFIGLGKMGAPRRRTLSRSAFGRRLQSCRSGEDGAAPSGVEKIVHDLRVRQILDGRDCEGQAERLDHVVLVEANAPR
jgi:hypothetical protein